MPFLKPDMRRLLVVFLNVIAGLALAAYTTTASIDHVANLGLVGGAFSRGLHARHVELAYEELEPGDQESAVRLLEKAELAARGDDVPIGDSVTFSWVTSINAASMGNDVMVALVGQTSPDREPGR